MILNEILLEGFGSFYNETLVTPNIGITGIVGIYDGEPTKSNGAGKSTLIMALIYALYGEGEFDRIEELLHDNADSMKVRITFTLNQVVYICERGVLKGKSYLNFYQNGVLLGDKIATAQESIIDILGMDYHMFTSSMFFEQGNSDKFVNAPADLRRKYVDKIVGNDVWTNGLKGITTENKSYQLKITTHESEKQNITEAIEKALQELSSKDTVTAELAMQITAKDTAESSLRALPAPKDYSSEYLAAKNDGAVVDADMQALLSEIAKNQSILTQPIIYTDEALCELQAKVTRLTQELHLVQTDASVLPQKIEALYKTLTSLAQAHATATAERKTYVKAIEHINIDVCPECEQSVQTDYKDDFIAKKQALIDQCDAQLALVAQQEITTKEEVSKLSTLQSELRLKITKAQEALRPDTIALGTFEVNQKAEGQRIAEATTKLKELTDKRVVLETRQRESRAKIDTLQACMDQKDPFEEQRKVLAQKISELTAVISENTKKVGRLDVLSEQNVENNGKLNQLNTQVQELQGLIAVCNETQVIFERMPRLIFKQYIKEVEDSANFYIKQVYPNMNVRFYEDTSKKSKPLIIDSTVDGKIRSYKRLSGGQKTIFNIGVRLGFSKMIMKRAQTKLELLVLDEPFGALDEKSRSEVKKILAMLSTQFKQIFIITHTNDLREFPNIITVRMNSDSCSYV